MPPIKKILELKDPNDFGVAITDWILGQTEEFGDMPEAQQVVYCMSMLEMEVNNGGFEQCFYNSSGDTVPETLEALKTIGAKKCAAIVAKAVALFPKGEPPRDSEARQARLEKATSKVREGWEALDQKFFEYPDDLASLLQKYVLANKDQFLTKKK